MPDFVILTDSMSDVPLWFAKERNIIIIPAHYTLNGIEYEDEAIDSVNHAFYESMRAGEQPTTSQVNTDQYLSYWMPLVEAGTPILHIAFSSALSGTYNSGVIARDIILETHPSAQIYISDSLCASCGGTLLLHHLVNMRDAGHGAQACYDWCEANKLNIHHWFTVESLEYLKRGGRISAAAALIGTMLNIKPVLNVNNEGKLIPRKKAKGRKNALRELADRFGEHAVRADDEIVWLSHADVPEEAESFATLLQERFGIRKVHIGRIGALVGCHAGPGTIALFFMGSKREE